MLRLLLTRHGETTWNAEQRLQGASDVPLNATGRAQAAALAERLVNTALDHIYVSALERSRETAAPLAGRAPVTALAELNEHDLGAFDGRSIDEPTLVRELRRRLADPTDRLDGGESLDDHFARVSVAAARIRAAHAGGTILVIGHGGTNRQLLRAWLGLRGDEVIRYNQRNTELWLLEFDHDEVRLLQSFPDGTVEGVS